MRHSGDQLDESDCMGQHTIDVDLARLSLDVRDMFITISAYEDARLSVRAQPAVVPHM